MPDSYVTSATITNGKLELSVRVDDFTAGEYVEVSGQATQTGGAFANIYDIQQVPAEPNVPADPNITGDKPHFHIYVTGAPVPHQFMTEQDVTTVIRVAKVWLTVLGPPAGVQPAKAGEGTTWDIQRRVSELAGGSW